MALDLCPSDREVSVAFRQRPDAMQVIRQENPCIDIKRMRRPSAANGFAQCRPHGRFGQYRHAAKRIHGEEVSAASDVCSSAIRHGYGQKGRVRSAHRRGKKSVVQSITVAEGEWCAERTLRLL